MPDTIKTDFNPLAGSNPNDPNVAAHNADVAQKLEANAALDKLTKPGEFEEASTALDKLAAQITAPQPTEEEKAAAEKAAAEKAAAEKAAAEAAMTPEQKAAAEKAAAEKAAADAAAAEAQKKADEVFKDSPQLPQGASPKSSEAFTAIKLKAVQDITARDAEIERLKGELAKATGTTPSPELLAQQEELKQLREWRAKMDVDFDPKFAAYDKHINDANEFIYAQLRQAPNVTEATISQIKNLGGPANVNLGKLFESINDPTLQRIVEAKIADVAQIKYEKQQAIGVAKANISDYMAKRQTELMQSVNQHNTQTQKLAEPLLAQFEFLKEKPGDIEHNKFAADLKGQIEEAMKDDSVNMRAILIAGMAKLFWLQREHEKVKTEDTAKISTLQKERDEAVDKLERIKKASLSRGRESGAPADGRLPNINPSPASQFNTRTADALDAAAQKVMEERQAKGA